MSVPNINTDNKVVEDTDYGYHPYTPITCRHVLAGLSELFRKTIDEICQRKMRSSAVLGAIPAAILTGNPLILAIPVCWVAYNVFQASKALSPQWDFQKYEQAIQLLKEISAGLSFHNFNGKLDKIDEEKKQVRAEMSSNLEEKLAKIEGEEKQLKAEMNHKLAKYRRKISILKPVPISLLHHFDSIEDNLSQKFTPRITYAHLLASTSRLFRKTLDEIWERRFASLVISAAVIPVIILKGTSLALAISVSWVAYNIFQASNVFSLQWSRARCKMALRLLNEIKVDLKTHHFDSKLDECKSLEELEQVNLNIKIKFDEYKQKVSPIKLIPFSEIFYFESAKAALVSRFLPSLDCLFDFPAVRADVVYSANLLGQKIRFIQIFENLDTYISKISRFMERIK